MFITAFNIVIIYSILIVLLTACQYLPGLELSHYCPLPATVARFILQWAVLPLTASDRHQRVYILAHQPLDAWTLHNQHHFVLLSTKKLGFSLLNKRGPAFPSMRAFVPATIELGWELLSGTGSLSVPYFTGYREPTWWQNGASRSTWSGTKFNLSRRDMHICRHYRLLVYDNREMGTAVFLFSKNENLHFQEGSGSLFEKVVMFMSYFFYCSPEHEATWVAWCHRKDVFTKPHQQIWRNLNKAGSV